MADAGNGANDPILRQEAIRKPQELQMQLGQLIQRAMQQGAANNGAADGANAANTIVPDGQNDPQDGIRHHRHSQILI